jgi:hypothetical protein
MEILGHSVKLVSKDGQTFIYNTKNNNKEDCIKEALDTILDKGWDMYEYKFKDIEILYKG